MSPMINENCDKCIHFIGFIKGKKNKQTCNAFDDIPIEIITGENNHTKPLPEQENNIVFEEIK